MWLEPLGFSTWMNASIINVCSVVVWHLGGALYCVRMVTIYEREATTAPTGGAKVEKIKIEFAGKRNAPIHYLCWKLHRRRTKNCIGSEISRGLPLA